MRIKSLGGMLSLAVTLGLIAGVALSLYEIQSHHYISYRMAGLISLTLQRNINASIFYITVGLLIVHCAIFISAKGRQYDRSRLAKWAVMAAAAFGELVLTNWALKKFTSYTFRSAVYDLLIKSGNLLHGIISLDYLRDSTTELSITIVILGGCAAMLIISIWMLNKLDGNKILEFTQSKTIKKIAIPCLILAVLTNLWVIAQRALRGPKGPNVVLIVVDTMRADHLGCYGYRRNTTPHIDSFCGDSVLFKNAVSTAPWTAPSMASILTSQYPSSMGYKGYDAIKVGTPFLFLPELFQNSFYTTKGIITNAHLSYRAGFKQGYDSYDEDNARNEFHISSPSVTEKAVSFLEKHKDDSFFLYIHYFDPHYSYFLHREYDYLPGYNGRVYSGQPFHKLEEKAADLSPMEVDYIKALYDSEINFTDEYIGKFLQALKELGLYDTSLIVITADHGEEFLERGDHYIGHGKKLFQEQIHVPLIIKLPGVNERTIIEENVSLIDLMPVIAKLAGISIPEAAGCQGRALVLREEEAMESSPVFSETTYHATLQSVIRDNWKLIYDPELQLGKLFNLEKDPGERKNVAGENENILGEMNVMLERWSERIKKEAAEATEAGGTDLDEEQQKKLKALGYLP